MVLVEGLVSVSGSLLAAVLLLLLLLLYLSPSGPDPRPEGCRPEPPGPRVLPLLGNLLQLDLKRTYRSLCELSKKYGPVFTVSFGPKKVVVLAGYKTVKQALQNQAEEFADRDITPVFHDLNHGHGIIFSNGENWREMRRFALSNLRDFGMGKRGSEEKIIEETRHLVEVLENFKGGPCDTAQPLNHAVSNIISAIVYGNRFEYDDPLFRAMVDRANHNFKLSGSASMQVYNLFPSIGPWVKNRRRLVQNSRENMAEMKSLIAGLRTSLDPSDCRGFVDSFLVRGQSEKESDQRASLFHEENLVNSVSNLFSAGTDTTGTTLRWGLLLMAKYPHIQGKI
ncbi:cytochrome P450 2K3-like [Clupea harengus]|uniref:Cytochrome P450 2K3-like n=1 Tax=Clupea harengus TaxID=7950 RepID=A0A8M1KB46_CLUHA|nr:cytochrome P450 2K3-like [Clupea harengus]